LDLQRAVALSVLPGISRLKAAAVFKALTDQSGGRPISLEDVVEACRADADAAAVTREAMATASALLSAGAASGIAAVPIWAPEYPALLRTIVDPPSVLWVRGDVGALAGRSVAVIGSRAATPYALEVARRLAGELAGRGVTVVSGLARGADAAAHRGSLEAGGSTVALRQPDNAVALAVLDGLGQPLTATSANRSGAWLMTSPATPTRCRCSRRSSPPTSRTCSPA